MDRPYLLFLGDAGDQLAAKTAQGVAHWRADWCVGQFRMSGCKADLGLDDLGLAEAVEKGAKTLVIGVANSGGVLNDDWTAILIEALEAGMDIASGLHMKLAHEPAIHEAAERLGRQLFDVRHPDQAFETGTGVKRPGKRLLTVGTDCSVGKMYAALAIEKEMQGRGLKADFRATGQTGIFIAGGGVSVDAVVADFISGATEWLTPDAAPDHWDIIEGQGSLFHPAFAGVSLGLLHGAQPDILVLCHEPTRDHMRGLPGHPIPDLEACLEANLAAARLTNAEVSAIGVAVNTSGLEAAATGDYLARLEDQLALPCVDPFRDGVARIVDQLP